MSFLTTAFKVKDFTLGVCHLKSPESRLLASSCRLFLCKGQQCLLRLAVAGSSSYLQHTCPFPVYCETVVSSKRQEEIPKRTAADWETGHIPVSKPSAGVQTSEWNVGIMQKNCPFLLLKHRPKQNHLRVTTQHTLDSAPPCLLLTVSSRVSLTSSFQGRQQT